MSRFDRRQLVGGGAALVAASLLGSRSAALSSSALPPGALARPERRWKKAVKIGMVREGDSLLEKFQLLRELGFDGVELDSPNGYDTAEVLAARDESGLPIHGVVDSVHWSKPLSHPDGAVRAEGLAGLETALRDAHAYGASTVLLVPAVVSAGLSYEVAYQRSQREIRKLLPLAEELRVWIAFENVWNNFLLSPVEAARYVDEFESPWIGWYFDVGNIVRYGWPHHWVETLGHRVLKVDVKEYSRSKQMESGPWSGFDVPLLEGDCEWPRVAQALDGAGYQGWFTAEISGGDRERLAQIAERMDRILAS